MLAFYGEGVENDQVRCHVSPDNTNECWVGGTESRPQKVLGSYSGLPLSTRWAQTCPPNVLDLLSRVERQKECHIPPSSTSLPAPKSGMGVSFLWETMGLLSLTKQRRKHLKKMWSLKELWSCLLKTSRAQDISKSLCICLEVQGVSEVCLNTNRILGQDPVRRMLHRLR